MSYNRAIDSIGKPHARQITRRHYEALATALHHAIPQPVGEGDGITLEEMKVWRGCLNAVADMLHADNPRFDRKRFEDWAIFGGRVGDLNKRVLATARRLAKP